MFSLPEHSLHLIYNDFLSRYFHHKVLLSKSGVKVKVIRQVTTIGNDYKVLLSAGSSTCADASPHSATGHSFYSATIAGLSGNLDYNQLKIRILSLFDCSNELHSDEVLKLLSQKHSIHLRDKGVEMALLRYWRQGLLSRVRKAGRFHYRLTEKGQARKEWLGKTK